MSQETLAIEEGFWRLLLGNRFDKLDPSDQNLETLADIFYQGRKPYVDAMYGSKDEFVESLHEEDTREAQRVLLTLWAQEKWERKSSGDRFEFESEFQDELDRLKEEGLYIEELSEGFTLAWPSEEVRLAVLGEDGVRSELLEEAHPLFLKQEENTVEVRGSKSRVKRFTRDFTDTEDVKKIERKSASESIIEGLSTLFTEDIGSMELTEIEFRDSNLPRGSAVTLRNHEGVRPDLNSDVVKPQVVDFDNLSSLNYLKFRHTKSGKSITVNVQREESGFYFEIQDSYLSELEKENIKEVIENELDISFTSIYPYDVQHDEPYVVHQILAENIEAYKRYFSDLSEENKDFLVSVISIPSTEIFECRSCQEAHEGEKPEECERCGGKSFKKRTEKRVEVDDEAIHNLVLEAFADVEGPISADESTTLLEVEFSEYETKYNTFVRSTFNQVQSAGAGAPHQYEYLIYCLGNGRPPRRINRYLLNSVMVTYGKSHVKQRNDFGTIDLYDIVHRDDSGETLKELFSTSVLESQSKLRRRVSERADDARANLYDLQTQVDNEEFEELTDDERDALKEAYDSDSFERDVFYLLKAMFLFTERWGRPGKTETDGCLVISQDDGYFVSGYDPKLTYDIKGYDLNAAEKKKAAYYILSESKDEYVRNVLKDGDTVDGHIFVSDIFRVGQFKHVAEHVQEWFSLVTTEDPGIDVPVVFLSLESLLEIYDVFVSNFEPIEEYSNVKAAFRDEFVNRLKAASDGYSVIDEDSTKRIRERVLEERGKTSRQRRIQTHAEDN